MIDNEVLLEGLRMLAVKIHHAAGIPMGHFVCEKGFYPELRAAFASILPVRDIEREFEEYKEFGYVPDRSGDPQPLPETYEAFRTQAIGDALLLFGIRVEFADRIDGISDTPYRIVLQNSNEIWTIHHGAHGGCELLHYDPVHIEYFGLDKYKHNAPTQRFEHTTDTVLETDVEKAMQTWQRDGWELMGFTTDWASAHNRVLVWKRPYEESHD